MSIVQHKKSHAAINRLMYWNQHKSFKKPDLKCDEMLYTSE